MTLSQSRREREKVEMRQLIVDAAVKLYLKDGYDKLSLRGIAQEISYAPGTIYLYFKDKHALFHAMHEWAFQKLLGAFETKLRPIKNPVERLRGISHEYLRFAFENPELYDLMFVLNEPMCATASLEEWACGMSAFQFLQDSVAEGIEQGFLKLHDPNALSFMLWSSVHGMIALHLRSRLRMYDGVNLEQLFAHVQLMTLQQFLTPKGAKVLTNQPH